MPLGATQTRKLQQADSTRIKREFAKLAPNWVRGRWLSQRNRYTVDCVEKLKLDVKPGGQIRHGQLRRYIAASSVIHCMDSWSYAARAIEAHFAGDTDASRHLGYYAELRAALSLLASAGVGVFDKDHFVVRSKGICSCIKGATTHSFVWDALQHWASQSGATDLVLSVIRPGGVPLSEWLRHFPGAVGTGIKTILAQQWLLQWGLDLQRFAEDRNARNVSSYRPTSIASRRRQDLTRNLDFVEHFWEVYEPSNGFPFKVLDRHLLRRSLAFVFQATHASHFHPLRAPAQFARLVKPLLHSVTPADLTEKQWFDFLSFRRRQTEAQLLVHSSGKASILDPDHHVQVIARATMLLRLATGASEILLKSLSSTDISYLTFWWHPIGEDRGFWETNKVPESLFDLWADVQQALKQLVDWRVEIGGHSSTKALISTNADAVRVLSSCERVAFWGLGL